MTKSVTLAVGGGDVRQVHLAALLQADGHTVRTFALDRRPVEHCSAYGDLRACFSGVQAVILPLPVQHGDGQLNAPLSNAPHPLSEVLDAIHARPGQSDLRLTDYLTRDELAIRNAVPISLAEKRFCRSKQQEPARRPAPAVAFCRFHVAQS